MHDPFNMKVAIGFSKCFLLFAYLACSQWIKQPIACQGDDNLAVHQCVLDDRLLSLQIREWSRQFPQGGTLTD